jgi:hypothetical protein
MQTADGDSPGHEEQLWISWTSKHWQPTSSSPPAWRQ